MIGVIEVNAFEVRLGSTERGQTGRGVFPLLAKLNHGCVSNARYINVEQGRVMECRATVTISQGQEVKDHYVSPLEDTVRQSPPLSLVGIGSDTVFWLVNIKTLFYQPPSVLMQISNLT